VRYWILRDFNIREVFDLVGTVLAQGRSEENARRPLDCSIVDTMIFRELARCLQTALAQLRVISPRGAAVLV
jgi:hypothetical protein